MTYGHFVPSNNIYIGHPENLSSYWLHILYIVWWWYDLVDKLCAALINPSISTLSLTLFSRLCTRVCSISGLLARLGYWPFIGFNPYCHCWIFLGMFFRNFLNICSKFIIRENPHLVSNRGVFGTALQGWIKEAAYISLWSGLALTMQYQYGTYTCDLSRDFDLLEKVQRRAVHFTKGNYQSTASVTHMLKELDWQNLHLWRSS